MARLYVLSFSLDTSLPVTIPPPPSVLYPTLLTLTSLHSSAPSKPPFYVSPRRYWPLPPDLALSQSGSDPDRIPSIVHFVFGYKEPGAGEEPGELMPYYAYLAVRSALVNIKPDKVLLWVARSTGC